MESQRIDKDATSNIVRQFRAKPEMLVQILQTIVARYGWVPQETILQLAEELNLSRADVYGVVNYYHDFRTEPPGRHIVKICQAEACQAMGSRALTAHARATLQAELQRDPQRHHSRARLLPRQLRLRAGRNDQWPNPRPGRYRPLRPARRRDEGQPLMARTKIYVPRETSAVSVGANEVALAITREARRAHADIQLIRNGSWGATWLEPLVEVEVDNVRIAYGNVTVQDVPGLFAAGLLTGERHERRVDPIKDVPYLINQDRWTFWRCGLIDALSLDDFRRHQGFNALEKAFAYGPDFVLDAVTASGLRGRGGAGFPTGIKWRTVAETGAEQKYIACNADEGDSGTFSDRLLMEGDPFALIESMAIAGFAVGASKGYIYLRSEYPLTHTILTKALDRARESGWLGSNIRDSGFDFDIELHLGGGSYVCGEETAMLESLEGRKGIVRYKPPLPAHAGLFGKPTVVNNVVTLASVLNIVNLGGERYAKMGVNRSKGTLAFQLSGNIKRGGLVEKAFGITVRELIDDWGGGTASGRPIKAVQVGGPLGAYLTPEQLDTPLDYEAFARNRRNDRARRHRRVRRHRRYGTTGPVCDGILCNRVLRQVHTLQNRLHTRRGSDRSHDCRRQQGRKLRSPGRTLRHDGVRVLVRDGRHDALSRSAAC